MTQDVVLASDNMKYVLGDGIGFLIVVALLAWKIVPAAGKAMNARQKVIREQLEAAEAASRKLAEAQSSYDAAVAAAKEDAARLEADAKVQYEQIVSEATAAAEARAAEVTARAQEALEAERIAAVRSLQGELTNMAVEIAQRKVHEGLADEGRQRRVTDRFLADLESGRISAANAEVSS